MRCDPNVSRHQLVTHPVDGDQVFGFTPVAQCIAESHPDILAIRYSAVFGIARMIFADEEQEVAIRRNSRSQFRQVGIDTGTKVLNFDDSIFFNDILSLSDQFSGCIDSRLGDSIQRKQEQQKKREAVFQGLDL